MYTYLYVEKRVSLNKINPERKDYLLRKKNHIQEQITRISGGIIVFLNMNYCR